MLYKVGRAGQQVNLTLAQEQLARSLAATGKSLSFYGHPTIIKRRGYFLMAEASRRGHAVRVGTHKLKQQFEKRYAKVTPGYESLAAYEKKFGKIKRPKKYQGPVRPTTDVKVFRKKGIVLKKPKKVPIKRISWLKEKPSKKRVIKKLIIKIKSSWAKRRVSLKKFREITTLGLTKESRERAKINKEIEDFNKRIESFDKRYGDKELTQEEYDAAIIQNKSLKKIFSDIEKKEKELKKATPTIISERTQTTIESLRKQRIRIIQDKGWAKALIDPNLKKIDKKLMALGVAKSFISFGIATLLLPETIVSIAKDPAQLKKIPSALRKEAVKFGKIAMISPKEAIAKVGAEFFLLKGTGKAMSVTGKLSTKAAAKVSGKFRKIKAGEILIKPAEKGRGLTIKTISVRERFKKPKVEIKITKPKVIKPITLKVIKPGLKKIIEPTATQKALIGKKIKLVTSAQANQLFNLVKRKRVIRKPIPGEVRLSVPTKRLLKKFDKGKISKTDFIKLNKRIIKETKGQSDLLERSFFVDPKGRVRVSRLGIQKEASLSDILRGDFTFKTQKPQIIFFENIKVQQFPKTKIFKSIKQKLAKQKTLKQAPPKFTKSEYEALLKFQTKVSGKFKPIGKLTVEPELTLAPGEIIKRVKTVAKVEINGVLVPIVKAKVIKASKSTRRLLSKAKKGNLTGKEMKILRKRLKKETGFKTPKISRRIKRKPKLPARRIGVTAVTRALRKTRKRKRIIKRPIRPKRPKRPVRPKKPKRIKRVIPRVRRPVIPVRPKKPGRPERPVRIIRRPIKPAKIIRLLKRKKKIIKPKKKIKVFNVYARPLKRYKKQKRPKLIKVNKVPLTKKQAQDMRNYITDTSLARTGKIKPTRGKPGKSRLKVPIGYAVKTKFKFRTHRRFKKKRIPLKRGRVIEKRKHLIDSRGEKKGLTLRRAIAKLKKKSMKRIIRKPIKRIFKRPKRKITSAQRNILLTRLKKARAVRMKNLRGRK